MPSRRCQAQPRHREHVRGVDVSKERSHREERKGRGAGGEAAHAQKSRDPERRVAR